jgi:hypothetical protein
VAQEKANCTLLANRNRYNFVPQTLVSIFTPINNNPNQQKGNAENLVTE